MAPMSDGSEGFLDAFAGFGRHQFTRVTGPLGARVEAQWLLGRDSDDPNLCVAVVESALAIGLSLAGGLEANDPVGASSAGVGQLVAAAVKAGARQVLVGLGGTATTDGGLGAIDALAPSGRQPNAEIFVGCDVETKFLEAAAIFSPPKGAAPAQVELLSRRLERVAQLYEERFGVDVRELPGGGAAGGLAGGLAAIGAKLLPGFDLVADRLSLAERIATADLVVTGEGHFDGRSLAGRVVGGVANLASLAAVPLLVVAGDGDPAAPLPFVSLVERFGAERSWSMAADCVTEVVADRLARGTAS